MTSAAADGGYSGSIPDIYDRCLGPMLFAPYADALAEAARALSPRDILETAAGTGLLTARLRARLPDARIVATDLNAAMLDVAARRLDGTVDLSVADACALPQADRSVDLVACQFGAMFFPDPVRGHAEAYRVLRPGGSYLLAIWDALERNTASSAVHAALATRFPDDPPQWLARAPYGHADPDAIRADLVAAGFDLVEISTVTCRGAPTPAIEAARGLCDGTPLQAEIGARDPDGMAATIEVVAAALRARGGDPFVGELSAFVVRATR